MAGWYRVYTNTKAIAKAAQQDDWPTSPVGGVPFLSLA